MLCLDRAEVTSVVPDDAKPRAVRLVECAGQVSASYVAAISASDLGRSSSSSGSSRNRSAEPAVGVGERGGAAGDDDHPIFEVHGS